MKTRILVAIMLSAMVLAPTTPALASNASATAVMADAILVRPACLVATVLGSTVFVLGLPFAAASKSVKTTAHVLVVEPAHAAFTRPMGDFDAFVGN